MGHPSRIREAGGRGAYGSRPTFAAIDLDAIAHNLRCVRRHVAAGTGVYAVVKADAYGHGLIPVARRLEKEGVDGICVALAEEGFRLRDADVRAPILVLNGAYGESHRAVLEAGLTPVIHNLLQVEAFVRAAGSREVPVHLKVDTGMGRLGVPYGELPAFLKQLRDYPTIRMDGLLTHLASPDSDRAFTSLQCQRFSEAIACVEAAGHRPRLVHLANSPGAHVELPVRSDILRIGLSLYGVPSVTDHTSELLPAMRVVTEVLALRQLGPGAPVGYGGSFRTVRDTRIATVPIGYGDGYLRAASNRGVMLVRGERCPIVGRVSMDLITLDVTHLPEVEVGDEVVVLGQQGREVLTADDLAAAAYTIPYEVLCNLSVRVPRIYLGAVASDD